MNDLIDRNAFRKAMYHEAMEKDSDEQKWESGCWIRYKMFTRVLESMPSVPPSEVIPKEWDETYRIASNIRTLFGIDTAKECWELVRNHEIERIKHGRWIRTGEDGYCSICKCDMPMFREDWEWKYTETPYCPNCNARMDEEGEEE